MERPLPVAVYDFDGTIYRKNVLEELVSALVAQGVYPEEARAAVLEEQAAWQMIRDRDSYNAYMDKLVRIHVTHIAGKEEAQVQRAADLVVKYAPLQLYVYTSGRIEEARDTHFQVIISGAPQEIITRIGRELGIRDFHGSQYEVIDGIYTGNAVAGHRNKDQTLLSLVDKHGLTLEGSEGIGDTDSDAPMLRLVTRATAFNPNKELRDEAHIRGWEVVTEYKDVIGHPGRERMVRVGEFGHFYPEL